jgi:hypothetical protein
MVPSPTQSGGCMVAEQFRFVVEEVFAPAGRGGVIAVGQAISGSIEGPIDLELVRSSRVVPVLGIEFHRSATGGLGLVLDEVAAGDIKAGDELRSLSAGE